MNRKEAWMLSLKVGNVVQDCNYRNKKIAIIKDRRLKVYPNWYHMLIHFLPWSAWKYFNELGEKYLGKDTVIDRTITFEDGKSCSAMNCCDEII